MFDRLSKDASGHHSKGSRARSKAGCRLRVEPLEGRALLASLAPIPSVTVEGSSGSTSGAGYQVPLNGATNGNTDPQTYTVTTDNTSSGVTASIASGEFWTIGVTHASSGAGDPAFSGTMTFQLFQDLTPNSVSMIESLINGTVPFGNLTTAAQAAIYPNGQGTAGVDYYTAANGGDTFGRVQGGFPDVNSYIVQGGAIDPPIMGTVFATPYANETSSQLVFNGTGQLALANSGGTDTQDSQFFVTTGSPRSLDGAYTIFGQLVAGANILQEMTQAAGSPIPNESLGNTPTSPITITSSTLSTTNPNGVVHINATAATANTLTNVTVTATDTVTNTQTFQTFPVITIPPATGSEPTSTAPMLNPVTTPVATAVNTPVTFQLTSTNPSNATLTYVANGGLDAGTTTTGPTFNATVNNGTATVSATGLVTVTPTTGYTGPINVLVGVTDGTNRAGSPGSSDPTTDPANYSLQNVTVNVGTFSAAPTINPVTTPINASVSQTVQIQLSATNPSGGQLSYTVQGSLDSTTNTFSAPTNATAAVSPTGLVSVVPDAGYTGPIDLVVGVRDQTDRSGTGNIDSPSNYSTQNIVINVAPQASTGAVRFIQDNSTAATGNLIVTPLPQTTKNASNTIDITQNAAGDAEVIVNGTVDTNQPALNDVESIIVYGSKANDRITVDPAITVPVSLSGGTGGKAVLTAGGGPTEEQGWHNTTVVEKEGESTNYLFGKAGKVTFVEGSGTSDAVFAGTPGKQQGNSRIRHLPAIPSGTFYTFTDGKLVKTSNPFTTKPKTTPATPSATDTTSSADTKKK
jgi:cyclophilin family peptidyl-prolyl cis-trans isomerase